MRYATVLAIVVLSAGCGGGGGGTENPSPQPPPPPPPQASLSGLYDISIADMNQNGQLLADANGRTVYASREYVGFADFQLSGASAIGTLTFLDRPIDDLNNEFPSAKDASLSKQLALNSTSSNGWSGSSALLTKRPTATPALANVAGAWRYRNLYRFDGSTFLDYTADLDVSTSGELSGFDTNGCIFTGAITTNSDSGPYSARINASNCGATTRYIDNYSYEGLAYVSENPTALNIVTVNTAARHGLAFRLSPRL